MPRDVVVVVCVVEAGRCDRVEDGAFWEFPRFLPVLSEVHPPTVPIRSFPETMSDARTFRFLDEPAGPLQPQFKIWAKKI